LVNFFVQLESIGLATSQRFGQGVLAQTLCLLESSIVTAIDAGQWFEKVTNRV